MDEGKTGHVMHSAALGKSRVVSIFTPYSRRKITEYPPGFVRLKWLWLCFSFEVENRIKELFYYGCAHRTRKIITGI
jgi:hypothetical protein